MSLLYCFLLLLVLSPLSSSLPSKPQPKAEYWLTTGDQQHLLSLTLLALYPVNTSVTQVPNTTSVSININPSIKYVQT